MRTLLTGATLQIQGNNSIPSSYLAMAQYTQKKLIIPTNLFDFSFLGAPQ